jgi:HK97 family phage portal protein
MAPVPSILSRVLSAFGLRAAEGAVRPGPYYLPITGGWLPADSSLNWWQLGFNPEPGLGRSAIVEACVSAYAQTVATCPGDHWRLNAKGGKERVKNSAASRVLRRPNDYQSMSDFMHGATRSLYLDGNTYALALRNDRFEIDELHLMRPDLSFPMLADGGEVFYQLYGNDVINKRIDNKPIIVPQRDVLHVRLNTRQRFPRPLIGESPLLAALDDIGVGSAIAAQQKNFYRNEARPSAVLSTDLVLDKDQTQALRDRWNDQSKGLHQGGTPILTAGLKVQPWSMGGKDAGTAEQLKLSDQHIALVFRIPLQILGLGGGATYGSTELLMQSWIASGLGFCLNHIEESFGLLFDLKGQPDEFIAFDTAALLRSAHKERIEALARGVQGGIYSPNEAREQEGLASVKFGEEPRVQQQVVPLSAAESIQPEATHGAPGKIPPSPGASGPPAAPPAPGPDKPKGFVSDDDIKREVRSVLNAAARIGRRGLSA